MFKVPDENALKTKIDQVEKNYTIQKNDLVSVLVYTNNGERLVDPEEFINQERPSTLKETKETTTYLIDREGLVKLPLLDKIKLEGLTLNQAEEILQEEYTKFYQKPFVVLKCTTKRVIVLGAPGGQVIPLINENMRLVEILALAKGVNNDAKAHNIRVLRGDRIFVSDLSTFEGYVKGNLIIEPGDVVYVEPIRRPFSEGLRDYGPLFSIVTSLATLIVVIVGL